MSSQQAQLNMTKFWHAVGGLYVWEFITSLDYDWRVIRGQIPYRWTSWIYSLSRVFALVGMILFLANLDSTTPISCKDNTIWVIFAATFLCLAAAGASLLIVLRVIAIWNRNNVAVTLAIVVWVTTIAFHLHSVAEIRFVWDSTQSACVPFKPLPRTLTFVPIIIADMTLVLIIFSGSFYMRYRGKSAFGLAGFLWRQGVIWLALGCVVEALPLVFTLFHLNDSYTVMFEIPSVIIMVIATTRMHRSLVKYAGTPSSITTVTHERARVSSIAFTHTKQTDSSPIALDRMEIAVDRTFEQYPTKSKSDDDSSFIISTKSSCPLQTIPPSPAEEV